jgi:hypothetical protein
LNIKNERIDECKKATWVTFPPTFARILIAEQIFNEIMRLQQGKEELMGF